MSTYRYAGVSRWNGKMKARFCNDQMRIKALMKSDNNDIDIIELREPMSKLDAVKYLIEMNFDNGNGDVREALETYLEKHSPKPKRPRGRPRKHPRPEDVAAIMAQAMNVDVADIPLIDPVDILPVLENQDMEEMPF